MFLQSAGIILIDNNNNVVIARRSNSYGICSLIDGIWNSFIVNELTIDEYTKILTYINDENLFDKILEIGNFKQFENSFIVEKKRQFNKNIKIIKNGILNASIDNMLDNLPWIIPKGKIEINENLFQCALREFNEETNNKLSYITKKPLKIIENFNITYFSETTQKKYNYSIFICKTNINFSPEINFLSIKNSEIDTIHFCKINELINFLEIPLEKKIFNKFISIYNNKLNKKNKRKKNYDDYDDYDDYNEYDDYGDSFEYNLKNKKKNKKTTKLKI